MSGLKAKIEGARKLARDSRERAAASLLDVDSVLQCITRAAADGLNTLTIAPEKPLDLSGTEAARELVKKLAAAGASCEWTPRRRGVDGPNVPELTISW
ncbi:hypothetical protein CCR97_00280 [Rhodoplanes elegans]|uniref:Uncharacterized protein n=1 Tax=Rhodoplanes elegans TaxID=29408 RepID=A0A327JNU1_9BRAD|nr:hypothetical protein [Rhodoplanes elegans]MBK5956674.1 hypothetical protein [Rhodoplanes elegans]RAI28099.1 hypothetical protein CH338_29665 [Rhodoplanes elegans]